MRRIVILGAGLTGLSTAYHLAQRKARAVVVEKEAVVGGACRTQEVGGFSFDLTGHLLHLARGESHDLLAALGIARAFRRHRRRAGVALAGRVTPYPLQIHTHRLPPQVRRDCVLGFIEAHLARDSGEGGPESFARWVLTRFGEGFARHFFFPYNRKLFCCEPEELTTEWVGRYVPRPQLADVIDGAFGLYRRPVGYNATFLYPRAGGIACLAQALASRCPEVRCGEAVTAVRLRERTLTLAAGESLPWDVLVATIPLTHLVAMTEDLPLEGREAATKLRAVAVENLNLGIAGPAPRREHWLYVPEPHVPFYRVGIPSNHGVVAPAAHHTLSVEVSLPAGTAPPPDLEARCVAGLQALGLVKDPAAIVVRQRSRLDPAYVVFDANRPAAVAALRAVYRDAGVILSGRWAEWKYSTMEDALLDGAAVARRVAP